MPETCDRSASETAIVGSQVSHLAVKIPLLWESNIKLKFVQVESNFALTRIVNDATKYNHLIAVIDPETLSSVSDILLTPPELDKSRFFGVFRLLIDLKRRKLLDNITKISKHGTISNSQNYFSLKLISNDSPYHKILAESIDLDQSYHASPKQLVEDLKAHFETVWPVLTSSHANKAIFVHPQLGTYIHVLIWHDGVRKPLPEPYDGPFKVLRWWEKTFDLLIKEALHDIHGSPETKSSRMNLFQLLIQNLHQKSRQIAQDDLYVLQAVTSIFNDTAVRVGGGSTRQTSDPAYFTCSTL
ncbi:hypothetical protein HNY73_010288 [Argiope bruennichi]|uniref:DUF7041 domain-containing protein n=1 Tax=Argiope bruennichi TaxID=94029 RepID=A0A8T0F0L9_ARGBR|nr:hypothetical protein HNY73_010288 [Argiope bruennichi]